jgi:multiple sugar transport system ATP-binding protein
MVDVKLPSEVQSKIGRVEPGRKLIAGIRPEDFEDAALVAAEQKGRGTTFNTKVDLVEAMGAEYYVHFAAGGSGVQSSQVEDLLADQGGIAETTDEGGAVVVARLNAESQVKVGQPTEIWIDATKLHFFDADTGLSLAS